MPSRDLTAASSVGAKSALNPLSTRSTALFFHAPQLFRLLMATHSLFVIFFEDGKVSRGIGERFEMNVRAHSCYDWRSQRSTFILDFGESLKVCERGKGNFSGGKFVGRHVLKTQASLVLVM